MKLRWLRGVVLIGTLLWAAAPGISLWLASGRVRADDRNGDGQSDVWRTYDRQGRIVELAIDSNFDGRSDVREYYVDGKLVRRETDRNFDERIDLVEEFDQTTTERVRSVADSDFDGTADLLELFQDGRAVFEETAPRAVTRRSSPGRASQPATEDAPFVRFSDPFANELAFRTAQPRPQPHDSGWTSVRTFICAAPATHNIGLVSAARVIDPPADGISVSLGFRAPRGPPPTPRSA